MPTGYCTFYSEKHGGASDEKHVVELAEFAAKNLKPYGFEFLQIDGDWQLGVGSNGPPKNFLQTNPKLFPHGMKAAADAIRRLGLTPGIWFMPFAGTYNDPCFAGHADWFVKRGDGKPYDVFWTGTCFDMTDPGVQEHVAAMARRMAADWGYTYFKMDGMHGGTGTKQTYPNMGYTEDGFGDAVFHNPDKTNIEAYRDGIKLIRRAAGKGVFLLGCCIQQNMRSDSGAFGLLDAMRIGSGQRRRLEVMGGDDRLGRRAELLPQRTDLVERSRLHLRPQGLLPGAGANDLLLGGPERSTQPEQRLAARPDAGAAGHPAADDAGARPRRPTR